MSKIRKWGWASAVFGAVLVGFLVGAMPVGAETTRVDWMFSKDPSINGVEESSVVLQDSTDEGILGEPVELPILMYHNLVADQNDPQISQDSLWVGQFRQQMELLCQNGFHAVSLDQLLAFGETGAPLPEKAGADHF